MFKLSIIICSKKILKKKKLQKISRLDNSGDF